MSCYRILYNPLASNQKGKEHAMALEKILGSENCLFEDITQIKNYYNFFSKLSSDDKVVIAGGDGTLNKFINSTDKMKFKNDIYYFAAGSGNDFMRDIGEDSQNPRLINKYLENLPTVEVNSSKYKFLNGIGYGIDGYCCEKGDEMRESSDSDKPINYTMIAIKGLLFYYKPTRAEITVDGKKYEFKNVWLAPCMNGRFYGGGMMPAPSQDRLSCGTVSVMVMHCPSKLKTLAVFPSIFSGKHINHKSVVTVLKGKEITVSFDRPRTLQIDGETIKNVKEYKALAGGAEQNAENTAVDTKIKI